MKILQINNCHNRRGGADTVYLNTIKLLKTHGEEVIEFSQKSELNEKSEYSDFFVENFDVLRLPLHQKILKTPRQLYSTEAAKKLSELIEKDKPDVAHIHLYKGVLTASILPVLKKNKIPVVITLHDYSLLCPRNLLLNGDNKICEKCITSTTLHCIIDRCNRKNIFYSTISFLEYNINNIVFTPESSFDKIIAVSQFSYKKHQLRKNLQEKLVQLYNFFPDIKQKEVNVKRGNYYLYFGRLSVEKGLGTLIDAFGKLGKDFPLKIVGTGPLESEIKNKINTNKFTNIDMVGYKSGNQLDDLVKNCSFIIIPSECYENNPMTIIEGYALGKPVIGSKKGGIIELITDNITGYYFEMSNVADLVKVVQKANSISDSLYSSMSKSANDFAIQNFSEEPHYKKLLSIYNEVITHKNELP